MITPRTVAASISRSKSRRAAGMPVSIRSPSARRNALAV
jgi:hypothetical protein